MFFALTGADGNQPSASFETSTPMCSTTGTAPQRIRPRCLDHCGLNHCGLDRCCRHRCCRHRCDRHVGRTVHDCVPTLRMRARLTGRGSPARAVVRAEIKRSGTILLGSGLIRPEGNSNCARPLVRGLYAPRTSPLPRNTLNNFVQDTRASDAAERRPGSQPHSDVWPEGATERRDLPCPFRAHQFVGSPIPGRRSRRELALARIIHGVVAEFARTQVVVQCSAEFLRIQLRTARQSSRDREGAVKALQTAPLRSRLFEGHE